MEEALFRLVYIEQDGMGVRDSTSENFERSICLHACNDEMVTSDLSHMGRPVMWLRKLSLFT